jgi:hypothetical protein
MATVPTPCSVSAVRRQFLPADVHGRCHGHCSHGACSMPWMMAIGSPCAGTSTKKRRDRSPRPIRRAARRCARAGRTAASRPGLPRVWPPVSGEVAPDAREIPSPLKNATSTSWLQVREGMYALRAECTARRRLAGSGDSARDARARPQPRGRQRAHGGADGRADAVRRVAAFQHERRPVPRRCPAPAPARCASWRACPPARAAARPADHRPGSRSRRTRDQLGPASRTPAGDGVVEQRAVLGRRRCPRHRHVQRCTGAGADAALVRRARARVVRRRCAATGSRPSVRVEDVLRAVAVVHVPVDDEHALDAVLRLRGACGDGDVVEQAEAHGRSAWRGGRAAGTARAPCGPALSTSARVDGAARRGERGIPRRADTTVSASMPDQPALCAPPRHGAGRSDVLGACTRSSCARGGRASCCSTWSSSAGVSRYSALHDGGQPAHVLRMAPARVVTAAVGCRPARRLHRVRISRRARRP